MSLTLEAAQPLFDWANERQAIYMRKAWLVERARNPQARMSSRMLSAWNDPEPYLLSDRWNERVLTTDPILQQYKFCNVYRELDRVTVWIKDHICDPFSTHPNLWFMLAAARYINWPPALQELMLMVNEGAWPDSEDFEPSKMTAVLEARRARGEKGETGAYMIRAESDKNAPWYHWSKQRYVSEVVLGKLWEARSDWQHLSGPGDDTLQGVWEYFQLPNFTGWGPFMAYQVVVDMRWTRYLIGAPDIQTWAALGPGSKRGLNRLHGRPVDAPLSQAQGLAEMLEVRQLSQQPGVLAPWMHPIDLSDIQNCLCETDKYLRVKTGEGRPRAMYRPFKGWN